MKNESLIIKLEGQTNQIDANTLINTLVHYTAVINQINDVIGEGDRKVDLKINALERGSFIIDISLVESVMEQIGSLFNKENIEYLSHVVASLGGILGIYSLLKGKQIKKENESKDKDVEQIIENTVNTIGNVRIKGDTIINIYNNSTVRSAISKSIETAANDPAVEGINISSQGKDLIKVERGEFDNLIYDGFDEEKSSKEVFFTTVRDAKLTIITLSFETKRNWVFIFDGIKITMPMKDSILWQQINSGMRFAKGDAIKVDLEITKVYNSVYNAYENKKYRIIEFKELISRVKQSSLFEEL